MGREDKITIIFKIIKLILHRITMLNSNKLLIIKVVIHHHRFNQLIIKPSILIVIWLVPSK